MRQHPTGYGNQLRTLAAASVNLLPPQFSIPKAVAACEHSPVLMFRQGKTLPSSPLPPSAASVNRRSDGLQGRPKDPNRQRNFPEYRATLKAKSV